MSWLAGVIALVAQKRPGKKNAKQISNVQVGCRKSAEIWQRRVKRPFKLRKDLTLSLNLLLQTSPMPFPWEIPLERTSFLISSAKSRYSAVIMF